MNRVVGLISICIIACGFLQPALADDDELDELRDALAEIAVIEKKMMVPKSAGMYSEPGNAGAVKLNQAWMSELQMSTGTDSARDSQNLSRNIVTEWPS